MKLYDHAGLEYDVELIDDGTLDTVIEVSTSREIRFSQEHAAKYRDKETGTLTEQGWAALGEEAIEAFCEQVIEA